MKIRYIFLILIVLAVIYWIFFRKKCKNKEYKGNCEACLIDAMEASAMGDYTDAYNIAVDCKNCGCNNVNDLLSLLEDK